MNFLAIGAYLSMALVTLGFYLDIHSSLKQPEFGSSEDNKWWRDKYGYFGKTSVIKYLAILTGLLITSILCIAFIPGDSAYAGVLIVCIPTTLLPLGHGLNNRKINRNQRVVQIREWDLLRALVLNGEDTTAFWSRLRLDVINKGGRIRYKLFGWVYVELPGNDISLAILQEKIERMARKSSFPL